MQNIPRSSPFEAPAAPVQAIGSHLKSISNPSLTRSSSVRLTDASFATDVLRIHDLHQIPDFWFSTTLDPKSYAVIYPPALLPPLIPWIPVPLVTALSTQRTLNRLPGPGSATTPLPPSIDTRSSTAAVPLPSPRPRKSLIEVLNPTGEEIPSLPQTVGRAFQRRTEIGLLMKSNRRLRYVLDQEALLWSHCR